MFSEYTKTLRFNFVNIAVVTIRALCKPSANLIWQVNVKCAILTIVFYETVSERKSKTAKITLLANPKCFFFFLRSRKITSLQVYMNTGESIII